MERGGPGQNRGRGDDGGGFEVGADYAGTRAGVARVDSVGNFRNARRVVVAVCTAANIVLGWVVDLVLGPCFSVIRKWGWFERRIWPVLERTQHRIRPYVEKYGEIGVAVFIGIAMVFSGCAKDQPVDVAGGELAVEKVAVIENLDLPECMVIDSDSGKVYVSNVVTANEGYWVDDSNGFISLMSPDGKIEKLRWLESTSEMPVNNPKGMCILDGKLYFNDNDKLKYCSLKAPLETGVISLPGAKNLNDLATDGKSIWVTDTGTGRIFCVEQDRSIREIHTLDSINGITCYKGKLFAVSWGQHEVYELDSSGEEGPVPFGLASHFTALDGIEVLDDGRFVVRGLATGTPVAPFFGVEPPTGRRFEIMSIDILTVAAGKIVHVYHLEDWTSAVAQLTASN